MFVFADFDKEMDKSIVKSPERNCPQRNHATYLFILQELPNEAIIVNTIACALVALAILMPCILKCDSFRKGLENEADVESDVE